MWIYFIICEYQLEQWHDSQSMIDLVGNVREDTI